MFPQEDIRVGAAWIWKKLSGILGFPIIRGTVFWGAYNLIIRILLFRVLYLGALFSETPILGFREFGLMGIQCRAHGSTACSSRETAGSEFAGLAA